LFVFGLFVCLFLYYAMRKTVRLTFANKLKEEEEAKEKEN